MRTEELIIGHFEESLTPDQEGELRSILDGSAEARSLYEQHRQIHTAMVGEVATTAPSSKLDELVIGSALGVLAAGTIESGAAAWLTGKFVAIVSTVVITGLSVILLTKSSEEPAPANTSATKAPAAATNPAPSTPILMPPPIILPSLPEAPAATDRTTAREDRSARATSTNARSSTRSTPASTTRRPPMTLDNPGNAGTIEHGPKIKQQNNR